MGTKLQELRNGCFAKAMDDEPMFVLLARDPGAPALVRAWCDERERQINHGERPATDMPQITEARSCAARMERWREQNDGAWRTGLFARQEQLGAAVSAGMAAALPTDDGYVPFGDGPSQDAQHEMSAEDAAADERRQREYE